MDNWFDKAACKDVPSEIFYPDGLDRAEDQKREAAAKIICKSCPVAAECLMHAIENEEKYGVWGSFAPKERKTILSLFSEYSIDINLCKTIVNKEMRTLRARVKKNWV